MILRTRYTRIGWYFERLRSAHTLVKLINSHKQILLVLLVVAEIRKADKDTRLQARHSDRQRPSYEKKPSTPRGRSTPDGTWIQKLNLSRPKLMSDITGKTVSTSSTPTNKDTKMFDTKNKTEPGRQTLTQNSRHHYKKSRPASKTCKYISIITAFCRW